MLSQVEEVTCLSSLYQSCLHDITSYQHFLFYFGSKPLLYFLSVSSLVGPPVNPCLSVCSGPVLVPLVLHVSVRPGKGEAEPKG